MLENINIRTEKELYEDLKAISVVTGKSLDDIVAEALKAHIAACEKRKRPTRKLAERDETCD